MSLFFIVARTFNMRFTLNKCLSVDFSIISYKHRVVQQISRIYSLYTFEKFSLPMPAPGNYCYLDASSKCNHAGFVLLCLIYFI